MTFLIVILAVLLASSGLAQSGSQLQRGHPDWTGLYLLTRDSGLAGFQEVSPNLDDVVTAHLQPWARLKMESTNGIADDTGAICQLDGIFRYPSTVGGFLWLPGAEKILMVSTNINLVGVRRIYLNRGHPRNLAPAFLGDSIGHWDGGTLVIDTVGFNDRTWLMSGMEPHTEELHVTERIRLAAAGLLEIQSIVEDRKALKAPYTYTRYYKRSAGEMRENICNGEPDEQREWSEWRRHAIKAASRPVAPE